MSGLELTSLTASSIAILAALPITESKLNIEPIFTTVGFPQSPRQSQDKNNKAQSCFISATKTERNKEIS